VNVAEMPVYTMANATCVLACAVTVTKHAQTTRGGGLVYAQPVQKRISDITGLDAVKSLVACIVSDHMITCAAGGVKPAQIATRLG